MSGINGSQVSQSVVQSANHRTGIEKEQERENKMNDQMSIYDGKKDPEKIKVDFVNGRFITTSLNVANVFEKRHADVLRDIDNLYCSPDFLERNFALSHYTNELSSVPERKYKQYEMTRDGFSILVMGYTGEKAMKFKEAYIAKFNEMEENLSVLNPPVLPDFNDPVAAARAWANAKEQEIKTKQALVEAKTAIDFHKQVGDSTGLHSVAEAAKMLGTGRNRLFEWLRGSNILRYNNEPYQRYLNSGYFVVKESLNNCYVKTQTFITPKGLQWIQKEFQ